MTAAAPKTQKLVLVHLSDIHFRFKKGAVGGDAVLDEDVRRELIRDVTQVISELGQAHGILITGDVAFAGRPEEYQAADKWLAELCVGTKCDSENIWVVCGNHDVQRDIIADSKLLQVFQEELRGCAPAQVDGKLAEYFRDREGRKVVFGALQHYNEFAAKYSGCFSADQPTWDEYLLLNDGSKLRIWGVNSALGSNGNDNDTDKKLSLGASHCVVPREDAVEYMVLCHHPLDWLRDAAQVEPYLESRVRLQLFGHKHKQRVQESKVKGYACLKLHAGAVNPERDAPINPRYNCLAIYVETDEARKERVLCVDLYPRVWDADNTKFIPDSSECEKTSTYRTIRLPLDWFVISPTAMPAALTSPATELNVQPHIANPLAVKVVPEQAASTMWGSRRLVHRFLSLTFPQRMEVANQLKLLEPADSHVDDTELFKRLLRRATERSQLRAFFEAVEIMHTGKPPAENPFP